MRKPVEARPRAVTNGIRPDQYLRNVAAMALAHCLGLFLNTQVDIVWASVGVVGDAAVAEKQKQLLEWVTRWLRRRGIAAVYIWALERADTKGLHTHLLLHVPSDLYLQAHLRDRKKSFRYKLEAELRRLVGRPLVKAKGERTLYVRHRSRFDAQSQWTKLDYRMKGIGTSEAGQVRAWGMMRASDQGQILGKRTGVSRFLDVENQNRFRLANDMPSFGPDPDGLLPTDDRFAQWFHANEDENAWPRRTSLNGNRLRWIAGFDVEEFYSAMP